MGRADSPESRRHRRRGWVTIVASASVVAVLLVAWASPATFRRLYARLRPSVGSHAVIADLPAAPTTSTTTATAEAAGRIKRGRSTVAGTTVTLPPSFHADDGHYDLVIHFHGNIGLVEESFALANVDAAVVIVNVGLGSSVYEQYVSGPGFLPALLDRIDEDLARRGVPSPKRDRVVLSAWSAGYASVVRILETNALGDSLDAILLYDGFHAAYDREHKVDAARLAPFEAFARRAVAGEKLFFITHSNIDPINYPSAAATTDALLEKLSLRRDEGGAQPRPPTLSENHGIPQEHFVPLVPTTEVHAGSFHVRGFKGQTPIDHMGHLIDMSTLGLPELAERLASRPAR